MGKDGFGKALASVDADEDVQQDTTAALVSTRPEEEHGYVRVKSSEFSRTQTFTLQDERCRRKAGDIKGGEPQGGRGTILCDQPLLWHPKHATNGEN